MRIRPPKNQPLSPQAIGVMGHEPIFTSSGPLPNPFRTCLFRPAFGARGCPHCEAADLNPNQPGNCPTFVQQTISGETKVVAVWTFVRDMFNLDYGRGPPPRLLLSTPDTNQPPCGSVSRARKCYGPR